MFLMIDNYDSFTYILVQYLRMIGIEIEVYRNDAISIETIEQMAPRGIVISPGPGNPDQSGITLGVIKYFAGQIPLLGVCLGHQAMGQIFGGKVVKAMRIMHGKTSQIYHDNKGLFSGMPQPFTATRYHSLILDNEAFPSCLEVSAWTEQEEIMGLRHKEYVLEGVQFHPESILTEQGISILKNFVELVCNHGKEEIQTDGNLY